MKSEMYKKDYGIKLIPIHIYLMDKGLSDKEIGVVTLNELEDMLNEDLSKGLTL